jgi:chemotaxis signal transduction protein/chemotaxis methyl-accepting protein methylase
VSDSTELRSQQGLFASQYDEVEQAAEEIDFKMVTFSLAGKDYGIDIMSIAEIAKFDQFTFVPNTAPFVAGVYNLRGDIISVIDMRIMFNLPAPQRRDGEVAEGLILRLEGGLIGVIVDSIAKVVGISSTSIQPPHPIFADINIKYISGVVEHEGSLYVILDVERVLGEQEEEEAPSVVGAGLEGPEEVITKTSKPEDIAVNFVSETLESLRGFSVTGLNRPWVVARLTQWTEVHGEGSQVSTEEEADEFLTSFYSPDSGVFLSESYLKSMLGMMPREMPKLINVWNPGCGRGYETYSLAVALKTKYPDSRLKIWASDNDLLNVSSAPNLTFARDDAPASFAPFLVEGTNGYTVDATVKDSIVFEYSDILHENTVPQCDLILMRDVLSFLRPREQNRVVELIREKCRESTVIVLGRNEDLSAVGGFVEVTSGDVRAFRME